MTIEHPDSTRLVQQWRDAADRTRPALSQLLASDQSAKRRSVPARMPLFGAAISISLLAFGLVLISQLPPPALQSPAQRAPHEAHPFTTSSDWLLADQATVWTENHDPSQGAEHE